MTYILYRYRVWKFCIFHEIKIERYRFRSVCQRITKFGMPFAKLPTIYTWPVCPYWCDFSLRSLHFELVSWGGGWRPGFLLGRGSYGTVHEAISTAEQKDFQKPIAIKSASLSKSYTLQKEAQVLESFISVPEILQCHGSEVTVEDNGESFFNLLLECAPHAVLLPTWSIKSLSWIQTSEQKSTSECYWGAFLVYIERDLFTVI